jgi:hypothetical protein
MTQFLIKALKVLILTLCFYQPMSYVVTVEKEASGAPAPPQLPPWLVQKVQNGSVCINRAELPYKGADGSNLMLPLCWYMDTVPANSDQVKLLIVYMIRCGCPQGMRGR